MHNSTYFFLYMNYLLSSGISNINGESGESSTLTNTIKTKTLETTIGNNDDLGMREDLIGVGKVEVEEIVRTSTGRFNQGGPFSISFRDFLSGVGGLQDDLVGIVTTVVGGINDSLQDVTLITETDEDVISVSRSTRTLGFPTVTHVLTTTGQQDVGARSVMLVGNLNSTGTVTTESEINDGTIGILISLSISYRDLCKTYDLSSGQIGETLP